MPPRVMSEVAHALERDDELLLLVRETLSPLSVAISSLGVSWPCPQISMLSAQFRASTNAALPRDSVVICSVMFAD